MLMEILPNIGGRSGVVFNLQHSIDDCKGDSDGETNWFLSQAALGLLVIGLASLALAKYPERTVR